MDDGLGCRELCHTHLCHINSDDLTLWPYFSRRKEAVKASSAAEIDDGLTLHPTCYDDKPRERKEQNYYWREYRITPQPDSQ